MTNAHTKATFIKNRNHTQNLVSGQKVQHAYAYAYDSHDKRLFLCNNVVYLGNWKGWPARARRLVKIRFDGNE